MVESLSAKHATWSLPVVTKAYPAHQQPDWASCRLGYHHLCIRVVAAAAEEEEEEVGVGVEVEEQAAVDEAEEVEDLEEVSVAGELVLVVIVI